MKLIEPKGLPAKLNPVRYYITAPSKQQNLLQVNYLISSEFLLKKRYSNT